MTLNTALATALPPSSAATATPSAPGANHTVDATKGDAGSAGFAQALSAAGERRVAGRSTTEPDSSNAAPTADAASPVLPLAQWVIPWIAPITPAAANLAVRAALRADAPSLPSTATGAIDAAIADLPAGPAPGAPSGALAAAAATGTLPPPAMAKEATAEPSARNPAFASALSAAADRTGPVAAPPEGAALTVSAATAAPAAPAAVAPAVVVPAAGNTVAATPSPAHSTRADGPDTPLAATAAGDDKRTQETTLAPTDAARKELALPAAVPSGALAPAAVRDATVPALAVATTVGTPGWHEDVAQKFAHVVSLRLGEAEIRLNPAHLGPIGIEISYGDNQASVLISAAQPATRDALEQALPHLRELLAQQGIALGESTVRDQPGGEGAGGAAGASRRAEAARAADTASGILPADGAAHHGSRPTGLIDTFA